MSSVTRTLDVLVIGGGQAGLATGFHLRRTSLRFQIMERHARVGETWRRRFDSLVLFTPRAYSALPGLAVPGDPDGYPSKDEIADYLETYARHFDLPVSLGSGVRWLEHEPDGFRARTDAGETIVCQAVVMAVGPFQIPAIPSIAQQLAPDVRQFSPENYKNPSQVPLGTLVVVGDGATGRQIALELAASRQVVLAVGGQPRRVYPDRILGRSLFWWLDRLGILGASHESRVGRYLMRSDALPGRTLALDYIRRHGVSLAGRLTEVAGNALTFADGRQVEASAVIWATGYRDDSGWVGIPEVKNERGAYVQQRGLSPLPGLYFVGRNWQWSRGSALLLGVGGDAEYVSRRIVDSLAQGPASWAGKAAA
jgi:putative flavoprotein involved in K+ transport